MNCLCSQPIELERPCLTLLSAVAALLSHHIVLDVQDWQTMLMGETASRASPAGGAWRAAVVAVPAGLMRPAQRASEATSSPEARTRSPADPAAAGGGHHVQLEFFVSDGAGQEDRPHPDGAYSCVSPGGFKLQQGRLQPFPRARQAPSMLVSDLDGTMVGDGDRADAATREFRDYWEANAALNGSVLVPAEPAWHSLTHHEQRSTGAPP